MSRKRQHRLDGNHHELKAELEARGFLFVDCSQTNLGFDGLVAKHGRLTPIEIKDGSRSASRLRLTAKELDMHQKLWSKGVRIEILTGVEDLDVLGREHFGRREG